MQRPSWAPEDIDIERPSPARIYDYHLGGAHNFAVDRQVAEQIARSMPEIPLTMRANRDFLGRAVRFLLDAGIRQFLDLGSGIPTVGNVHEIALAAAPEARVVYVDTDPVAVTHSRAILDGNRNVGVVQADLRDVPEVLHAPEVRRLIDLSQPVAVLLVAVLHFIPDSDEPAKIVAGYRDAVAPGSYLVISHAAAPEDGPSPDGAEEARAIYSRAVTEFALRTRSDVEAMFAGMEIVEPGVVALTEWRPDPGDTPQPLPGVAGVARKPAA